MGLFDRLRGMKDPVEGTFRLVSCSLNSGGAVYENCTMDGVVQAPGFPPTAAHHTSLLTPTAKWPQPGQELPVTFERSHPDRMKIHWDQIPSSADVGRRLAQQAAAAAAAAGANSGTGAPDGASESAVLGAPGRPLPGAAGGGLTPQESAQIPAGGAAALGLQPASGRVLAAHRIDAPPQPPQAPGGLWDVTLDVTPQNGEGFTSVLRIGFSSPARQARIATVGQILPVVVDPDRRDRIAIDTSRI